jgi:hypothetical protein
MQLYLLVFLSTVFALSLSLLVPGHQFFVSEGDEVKPTTNCFTWMGCILLVHESEEHINRDYYRYHLPPL